MESHSIFGSLFFAVGRSFWRIAIFHAAMNGMYRAVGRYLPPDDESKMKAIKMLP